VILKVIRGRKHRLSTFLSAGAASEALGAQLQSQHLSWSLLAPCSEQGIPCFVFQVLGGWRG